MAKKTTGDMPHLAKPASPSPRDVNTNDIVELERRIEKRIAEGERIATVNLKAALQALEQRIAVLEPPAPHAPPPPSPPASRGGKAKAVSPLIGEDDED